jgi:hypothetical protein
MSKPSCPHCGKKMPFKNRYIITAGEMCTQEVLDQKTGKTFWGTEGDIINQLLKELNANESKKGCKK